MDVAFAHVTGDTLGLALSGMTLEFANGWNFDALANKVRKELSRTIPTEGLDPTRISNVEIRKQLTKLSKLTRSLEQEIADLDRSLVSHSLEVDNFTNFIAFILSNDSHYAKFHRVSSQLPFIAEFLEEAALSTKAQYPKWRTSEQRKFEVWRAKLLMPIFEAAFGQRVTVNNWVKGGGDARHSNPTRFMRFYEAVMRLAFPGATIDDLPGILKEARKGRQQIW